MGLDSLDGDGLKAILSGDPAKQRATDAAKQIVANVKAMGIKVGDVSGGAYEIELPVDFITVNTDRSVAVVGLTHYAGMAVQAKHGALTKAAAQAGLEVTEG